MKRRLPWALFALLLIIVLLSACGPKTLPDAALPASFENTPLRSPGEAAGPQSVPPQPTQAPSDERVTAATQTPPTEAPEIIPAALPSETGGNENESVTPIVPGFEYAGALEFAGQTRSYPFSLTRRGVLRYAFSAMENPLVVGDWDVSLYGVYYVNGVDGKTALRLLNVLSVNNVDHEGQSPNIGLMPGDYVIKVTAGAEYSSDIYVLSPEFTPSADYEIECNDTLTRYTEIYPDAPVRGSASYFGDARSDFDWYLLRLYEDTAVTLTFTHEQRDLTTVPFVVTLTDEAGSALYVGRSAFTAAVMRSGSLGLGAGIYRVCVESRAYSDMDYTLRLSRAYSGVFEEEPNDSFETATLLREGTELKGVLAERPGTDRDCFRLQIPEAGRVILRLANVTPDPEQEEDARRLTLYSSAGNAIWSDLLTADAEALSSPEIGVGPGTYYAVADDDGLFAAAGDYLLSYTFLPADDWEYEYNGKRDFANEITPGKPVRGTLSDAETAFDTDWFRFTVFEIGTYTLKLAHKAGEKEGVRFRLDLTDSHGEFIDALDLPDREGSVSLTREFAPGVWFVKLTAGTLASGQIYEFSVRPEEVSP